ncbi:MAG: hypothetical protein HKN30_00015 [Sulfitobacter sp.]|nr:hypothetical protein [Sulfitobacter sp.]
MTRLRLFLLIGLCFIALVWWTLGREQMTIDRCLEEGGRWDYEAKACEG